MSTMPPKTLVVFTAGFPYGNSEPFLKIELEHLLKNFDQVVLVAVNPEGKIEHRPYENCKLLVKYHKDTVFRKAIALFNVFDPLFWKELKLIRKAYEKKITLPILATMLMGLQRAKSIKRFAFQNINFNSSSNLYFYSYWCDDTALGIAMLQRSYPNIKTFSRLHGWDVYFEVNEINYLSFRHFITKQLKAVFSISIKGKQYCANAWKLIDSSNVKVARLGVVPQKYLAKSKEKLIVTCSNLIPLKRVHLLVEALSQIKNISLKWVHFGDGPEFDQIKSLCQNTLPASINWELKGWIDNAEIMQWYERHSPSLFINLSTSEGIPVSIMEAMSFGIPAIATDVGGNSEIVTNSNGFLISSNPLPEEIAKTIETYFYLDPIDEEKMRQTAYNTWKTEYNSEINYKSFCQEILSL